MANSLCARSFASKCWPSCIPNLQIRSQSKTIPWTCSNPYWTLPEKNCWQTNHRNHPSPIYWRHFHDQHLCWFQFNWWMRNQTWHQPWLCQIKNWLHGWSNKLSCTLDLQDAIHNWNKQNGGQIYSSFDGSQSNYTLEPGRHTPRSKFYALKLHWFRSWLIPKKVGIFFVESENNTRIFSQNQCHQFHLNVIKNFLWIGNFFERDGVLQYSCHTGDFRISYYCILYTSSMNHDHVMTTVIIISHSFTHSKCWKT